MSWQNEWLNSPSGRKYLLIHPKVSFKIVFGEQIVHQRTISKIRLNRVIEKHLTGLCGCNTNAETLEHYILKCLIKKRIIESIN